jgi:hypothetical protein
VADRGGQGQDALGDADGDALDAVSVVEFQVELAFPGVVDRLDRLADWFEEVQIGCRRRLQKKRECEAQ